MGGWPFLASQHRNNQALPKDIDDLTSFGKLWTFTGKSTILCADKNESGIKKPPDFDLGAELTHEALAGAKAGKIVMIFISAPSCVTQALKTRTRHRMPRRIWQTPAITETSGHEWLKGFLDQLEETPLLACDLKSLRGQPANSTLKIRRLDRCNLKNWGLTPPGNVETVLCCGLMSFPETKNPIYEHLFGARAH